MHDKRLSTHSVVLVFEVADLSNQSTSNGITYIRRLCIFGDTANVDTSIRHGIVVRILVLETGLSKRRGGEVAAVQGGRGEGIECLERSAGHSERMAERRGSLLLSRLDCGLLSPRNICTPVLMGKWIDSMDGLEKTETVKATLTLPYPTRLPSHSVSVGKVATTFIAAEMLKK